MRNFISEILKKLISTILFAAIMFVISYCLITGEFPPKIENMKKGLQNMQTQFQQLKKIQENQLAKLSQAAVQTSDIAATDQAEIKYQQALLDKIKDLEARIARLESKTQ
ncbi:hypothetical protein CIK05_07035 [Bdellovibrio sp. qaytius]|nr:hypothetical protein CIK05_07035 [Bdellovibrio sp. qaytius]